MWALRKERQSLAEIRRTDGLAKAVAMLAGLRRDGKVWAISVTVIGSRIAGAETSDGRGVNSARTEAPTQDEQREQPAERARASVHANRWRCLLTSVPSPAPGASLDFT
jgi:hypothetical protein